MPEVIQGRQPETEPRRFARREDYWGLVVNETLAQLDRGDIPIAVMFELSARLGNLENEAIRDRQTNALGRQAGMEVIEEYIQLESSHGQGVDVLLCDLDRFREVNTADPDLATNAVTEFVNLVTEIGISEEWKNMRVVRLGGEEMAIVIPHADEKESITEKMEKIRARVETDLALRSGIAHIKPQGQTVSIGGVRCTREVAAEAVLAVADQALYMAKEARNAVQDLSETKATPLDRSRPDRPGLYRWKQEDFGRQENILRRAEEWAPRAGERIQLAHEITTLLVAAEQRRMRDPFGALNREATLEEIETMIEIERSSGHRLGLILLDINNFADINNIFGHKAGDDTLKSIVAIGNSGSGLDVGRWGFGGSLMVLVPHADEGLLAIETEKLIGEIREKTGVDARLRDPQTNQIREVTVNAGAVVVDDAESGRTAADRAVNLAKIGKDRQRGIGMLQKVDGSVLEIGR